MSTAGKGGIVIAVDGPAASGKGTISRALARHFALPLLDTGLLYRAVGQKLADAGLDPGDGTEAARFARAFDPAWLEDPRLRARRASEAASLVAKVPAVRQALLRFQQDFARQPGGAVLDGRDIGTVIAPFARAKLWIDADLAVRAARRFRELSARGEMGTQAEILADLGARDARDAPNMRVAPDAILVDTSSLAIPDAIAAALDAVSSKLDLCGK